MEPRESELKVGEHKVQIVDNDNCKVGCQNVKRNTIVEILHAMDKWVPPTPKFKVGDYVRVLFKHCREGQTGKVIAVLDNGVVDVEFSTYLADNSLTVPGIPKGHGARYCWESSLEVIP